MTKLEPNFNQHSVCDEGSSSSTAEGDEDERGALVLMAERIHAF